VRRRKHLTAVSEIRGNCSHALAQARPVDRCRSAYGICRSGRRAGTVIRPPATSNDRAITDEVTRTYTLDVKDQMVVLEFVLGRLPERVKVYPTENYFYCKRPLTTAACGDWLGLSNT
jgi:hypothetical protein